MRDWNAYALEHLGPLGLAPDRKEEVAQELGEHLAEFYAHLRSRGVAEEEAFAETCAQVGSWTVLRDEILAAKKEVTMIDRLKQIWGPAALTFVFGYAALMFLEVARTRGMMSHAPVSRGLSFYLPWLLLLPVIGAASAYMSRHWRGNGWRVYLAVSFPVLVFAAVLLILVATVAAKEPQRLGANPEALALLLVDWVALPAMALCAGAALQGLLKNRVAAP